MESPPIPEVVHMVSIANAGSARRASASAVIDRVEVARGDSGPVAKSLSQCGEPEQSQGAVSDSLRLFRDGCHASEYRSSVGGVRATGDPGSAEPRVSENAKSLVSCSRPIAWRLLLGVLSDDDTDRESLLNQQRTQYNTWKREYMGPRKFSSQGEDTSDAALLKAIEQDICRTRSELPFFAVGGIAHQWMLRILFVHAKLHTDVGYIQGMNEILAPILFVYGNDSDEACAIQTEADAFHSFQTIIGSIKLLYLPAPSDPSKSGIDLQMDRLMLLLRQHDPVLWQHLNSIGVTPDLFSLRWYTTLLAREFPMPTTLRVWDALLSDPKRFSLVHYVNCALVRCRRSTLLRLGFAAALRCLHAAPPNGVDVDQILGDAEQMRARDRSVDQARVDRIHST